MDSLARPWGPQMILFHVIELDKDIKGPFTNPFDQLKEYEVTIIKKSLISTKKQQDRGKKMNGLVLVPSVSILNN